MKPALSTPVLLLAALACLRGPRLHGQSAPQPSAPADNNVVSLSPFEVSASSQTGYAAQDSLAGTRLDVPLQDTPVAVTVMTSDLMNDMGATDYQDVLNFVPSTEYYYTNGSDTTGNGNKNPLNIVVRGFVTTTQTRDLFLTQAPADLYLTDSIAFTRGPNSLLFGIGNPGGTVGITTHRAEFRGAFGELDITYDQLSSKRISLDQNVELVKGRVAIRTDLLVERKNLFVTPTGQDKNGEFIAATIHPFKNSNATTIYLSYEAGSRDDVTDRPFAPFDDYSTWVADGAPLYNNKTSAPPPATPTASSPFSIIDNQYTNILGQTAIAPFKSTVGNGYSAYVTTIGPLVNGAVVTPATSINGGYSITQKFVSLNPMNLLLNYFGGSQSELQTWLNGLGPLASIPESFSKGPVTVPLTDFISGPQDSLEEHWNIPRLIVDQRVGENFNFELAGNFERFDDYNRVIIRGSDYGIQYDPNLYLPNGQENPYAGVPYIGNTAAFATTNYDVDTTEETRLTTDYRLNLDNRQIFGIGLGNYSISTLIDIYNQEAESWQTRPYVTSVNGVPLANVATNAYILHSRYYLLPGSAPYVPLGDSLTALPADSPFQADWINFSGSRTRTLTESYAASLLARYWGGRVVVTAGAREDYARTWTTQQVAYSASNLPPGAYGGEVNLPATFATLLPQTDYRPINYSVGTVVHLKEWFSPFINYATNSNPGSVARNINLQIIPYLKGTGVDFGFKFSLFNNQLQGSYTHYVTAQDNVSGTTPATSIEDQANIDIQLAEPALYAQRQAISSTWDVDYNQITRGDEFEMVWNPVPNLRLRFAASDQNTITSGKYVDVGNFLTQQIPIWQAYASAPSTSAANAQTVLNSIPIIEAEEAAFLSGNGAPQVGDSIFSTSLEAHYAVERPRWLRGLGVGTAISYRGPVLLGYQINANGSATLANKDYGSGPKTAAISLDYSWLIDGGKYRASIWLQYANVFDWSQEIARQATWDYTQDHFVTTSSSLQDPQLWTLTLRFKY